MELSDTRYDLRGKIIRILKEKGSRGDRADKILELLLPTGLKHGEPVYDEPKQQYCNECGYTSGKHRADCSQYKQPEVCKCKGKYEVGSVCWGCGKPIQPKQEKVCDHTFTTGLCGCEYCSKCGLTKPPKQETIIQHIPKRIEPLNERNVRECVNGQDAIVVKLNELVQRINEEGR